jgi:MFS family permease
MQRMNTSNTNNRPTGMTGFTIVWAGQLISVLASSMTQFALTIWAYQETGSATSLGIISTAFVVPFLLLSPIAGVMVDRHNRKLMMMVSDLTAIIATVGILALHATGQFANMAFVYRRSHQRAWATHFNGLPIPRRSAQWCQRKITAAPMG